MKSKKTLWIVVGAVVALAVALAVILRFNSSDDTSAAETSAVTTKTRSTATWAVHSTETATTAENTTKKAAIQTSPSVQSLDIAAESECRSMGIGGGEFYYAVGYRKGDDAMQNLIAEGIGKLVEAKQPDSIADEWFLNRVFPRDTDRDAVGYADGDLLKELKETGVTIGVIDGNAPVAYFENGEAKGYEIDVAKALFALYNLTPQFTAVTADNAADKLKDGTVDLIWGGLRDGAVKGIAYSEANVWNLENELCYFTYSSKRYKGETELLEQEGKLAVVKDTLCEEFVKDRLQSAGYDTEIVAFASAEDAFAALKQGDVFCVACDYLSAYSMWKKG